MEILLHGRPRSVADLVQRPGHLPWTRVPGVSGGASYTPSVWGHLSASSLAASVRLFSPPGTPPPGTRWAPSPITRLCSARTPARPHCSRHLPRQAPGEAAGPPWSGPFLFWSSHWAFFWGPPLLEWKSPRQGPFSVSFEDVALAPRHCLARDWHWSNEESGDE